MNPTEQSGCDTCEQPVLTWTELRALAGLSLVALILFIGVAGQNQQSQSAAISSVLPENPPMVIPDTDVLGVDLPPSATTTPFSEQGTELPEAQ